MSTKYTPDRQLSFEVEHVYQRLVDNQVTAPIGASVTISGEIPIGWNLAAGERLTVSVSGPDGEIVGHSIVIASAPAFAVVEHKDLGILGFERKHKLKIDPNQHPMLGFDEEGDDG